MFFQRLISTIILLVLLFVIIFIKGIPGLAVFTILGVFLSIAVTRELSDIMCSFGLKKFYYINEIFAVASFLIVLLFNYYKSFFPYWIIIAVAAVIICWLETLISINKADEFKKVLNFCAVLIFFIVPVNFITMIFTIDYSITYTGVYMVLFLVLVTKSGDIGAYVTGTICSKRKSGNHKIVPSISPKKSWEGTIGGLIISALVAFFIGEYFGICPAVALVLGVILFVGGFIGDLAESSLKRLSGIKDSGNIIPGIGGTLDLVDSLLINAPIFYLILMIAGAAV